MNFLKSIGFFAAAACSPFFCQPAAAADGDFPVQKKSYKKPESLLEKLARLNREKFSQMEAEEAAYVEREKPAAAEPKEPAPQEPNQKEPLVNAENSGRQPAPAERPPAETLEPQSPADVLEAASQEQSPAKISEQASQASAQPKPAAPKNDEPLFFGGGKTPPKTPDVRPVSEANKKEDETLKSLFSQNEVPSSDDSGELARKAFLESQKLYMQNSGKKSICVVSETPEALSLGLEIAEKIEAACAPFLPEEIYRKFGQADAPAPRVQLRMLSPENAEFGGFFREGGWLFGGRVIDVKCAPDLPLGEMIKKMLCAHLRSVSTIANMSRGRREQAEAPMWIRLALATALAREISPGIIYDISEFSKRSELDGLEAVLKYDSSDDGSYQKEISAYWALMALRAALARDAYSKGVLNALQGAGPDKTLKYFCAFSRMDGETFLDTFKMAQLREILSRSGGVKNPAESDAEVLRMAQLLKGGTGVPIQAVMASEIFPRAKEFDGEIKSRINEIKYSLPRINPAYVNTLISLGETLEAALGGDEKKFMAARAEFAAELKKSRKIAEISRGIIRGEKGGQSR